VQLIPCPTFNPVIHTIDEVYCKEKLFENSSLRKEPQIFLKPANANWDFD
jgi:hypothetical protein